MSRRSSCRTLIAVRRSASASALARSPCPAARRLRISVLRRLPGGRFVGAGRGQALGANIPSITWGIGTGTIIGLDIATAFDGHAMYVQRCGLEGLLAATNTLGLAPLLASSWTYSPASLKYVFQIRPGVKFWDGTTMTVDDVVFSLTRHIDPKVSSQIGAYLANVASFTKTGPSEMTINLKRADPDVQNTLVFAPILSKAFVEKIGSGLGSPGSGLRIMGTGPYQISSFPSSTSCTVERFEGYWGAKPAVQKCSFTCIADVQTLLLAAQSGQIAGTFDVPVQNTANWEKVSSLHTYSAPGMAMFYLFVRREPAAVE